MHHRYDLIARTGSRNHPLGDENKLPANLSRRTLTDHSSQSSGLSSFAEFALTVEPLFQDGLCVQESAPLQHG
jgi:hypothetical protein